MIVTAFGGFGKFTRNPSEVVGRAVFGDHIHVLPVSFAAVDQFLQTLENEPSLPDASTLPVSAVANRKLLMLGVSGAARGLTLETTGTSRIGSHPDMQGVTRPRAETDRLAGTLFSEISTGPWQFSDDAGDYLCNYLYYEALKRLPDCRCGFVHVPSFCQVALPLQAVRLRRLAAAVA